MNGASIPLVGPVAQSRGGAPPCATKRII